MSSYDPIANGVLGYRLGFAARRELGIRQGRIEPREGNERELRWEREGIPDTWIDMRRLDTVRESQ